MQKISRGWVACPRGHALRASGPPPFYFPGSAPDHQHLSKCKRVCTSLAEGKIKELTKFKAPRGVYSEKTSESPPVIKSPPPVLRESPKHTQPSPPNELVKLHQIVKKVHIFTRRHAHTTGTHYRHILKGTQICYTKRQ